MILYYAGPFQSKSSISTYPCPEYSDRYGFFFFRRLSQSSTEILDSEVLESTE